MPTTTRTARGTRLRVTDFPREHLCLLGEHESLVARDEHESIRERRGDVGARRIILLDPGQSLPHQIDRNGIVRCGPMAEHTLVRDAGAPDQTRIVHLARSLGTRQSVGASGDRVSGLVLGVATFDEEQGAGPIVGLIRVDCLQREIVEVHDLVVGDACPGFPGRAQCVLECLPGDARCGGFREVVRELSGRGVAPRFQGQTDLAVEPYPAGRAQLLDERGPHEGMGEAHATWHVGDLFDEPRPDRELDVPEHDVLRRPGHLGDEIDRELPTDDRGRAQRGVRVFREPRQPATHHVADAFGDPDLLERRHRPHPVAVALDDHARLHEMQEHLAHEEGVPLGLTHEHLGERDRDVVELAPGRDEERAHPGLVDAAQRVPLDAGLAAEIAQHRGEGMRPVDIGVAVRHDDEDRSFRTKPAYQMPEQPEARRVGPVRVVEHDERGRIGRDRVDEVDRRVEQRQLLGLRIERARLRHIVDPALRARGRAA